LLALPESMKTDTVKKVLIDELEKEFDRIQKGDFEKCLNCDDGGEQGYYSWLFDAVSDMKDDRAFPLFVRIGSPTALVKYGDKGVRAILEILKTKSTCNAKSASIEALVKVLAPNKEGYVAQGAIREQTKKALMKTLEESKHPDKKIEWHEYRARECANVRIYIVRAAGYLAESEDVEILPIIESLAKNDPYYWIPGGKRDEESNRKYDVRDEAQKVLDGLKAKRLEK